MTFLLSSFASSVCCAAKIETLPKSNAVAKPATNPALRNDRMLPSCEPPAPMPRCAEFRRGNRGIYGDAMIARKIDLCGPKPRCAYALLTLATSPRTQTAILALPRGADFL